MSAFDDLKKWFKPGDRTIALPDDPFVVVDRDKTIASMRLDERGTTNGALNFPPAGASERDEVEEEIIAEIHEHANRSRINTANMHRLYNERLSDLALLRELSTVTAASAQALGDFKAIVLNRENRLAGKKDDILASYGELAEFRSTHGISRPAHEGIGAIYAYSWISISWLFESAGNTIFLRVNDDYGLIGGFIAAAVVAAINIFSAAIVGRSWWPYLFHKSASRRALAGLGCTIWFGLMLLWNLLAGHFRDAKGSGIEHPESAALHLLVERTWHLDSLYSYGLFSTGIIFAVLAALAAYKMKDPYPGYGDTYKRHTERLVAYADEIELAFDELKEKRDDAIDGATSSRDELRRQFGERGQIIDARESLRNRFRENQEYLQSLGRFLLSRYHASNVKARTDGKIPTHFSEKWTLMKSEIPVSHEESIDGEVLRAQELLAESISTIAVAYEEAISRFESLESIKGRLGND